jgi:N-acetyl-alpha-D-muramate 1-phosphate uridylyltransferase
MAGSATAMILAAGRGERMRPLTDTCPKPLLPAGGKPLVVHQIEALARAGHRDIAINAAHLADQLVAALGDGAAFGVRLHWSHEPEPLETAGGIATAFPLLAAGPVLIVSGDIWTAYDYAALAPAIAAMRADPAAPRVHLVMVPNPPYHPRGDFALLPPGHVDPTATTRDGHPRRGRIVALPSSLVPPAPPPAPLSGTVPSGRGTSGRARSGTREADSPGPRQASGVAEPSAGPANPPPTTTDAAAAACPLPLTFGNIGVYDSVLFAELPRGTRLKLLPLFLQWIAAGIVVGERFDGPWANVGTPDELARLDAALTDPG